MANRGPSPPPRFEDDPLTYEIIGAAIEVHRILGPGMLELPYEDCLSYELELRGLAFERQVPMPLQYKSLKILRAYKLDLIVERAVVIEIKSVDKLIRAHEAQVLTYLRLAEIERGLLINFNAVPLKSGIRRLVKSIPSPVSLVSHLPSVAPTHRSGDRKYHSQS